MKKKVFYLENELRDEWKKWNSKAHPEDQMSFIDFVDEIGSYKGYKVELKRDNYGDYKIVFVYQGK